MITLLQGLPFDTITPSHFCLVLPASKLDAVEVMFAGDSWLLFHQDPQQNVKVQSFPTRDLAIGVIAEAFRMEGL